MQDFGGLGLRLVSVVRGRGQNWSQTSAILPESSVGSTVTEGTRKTHK